MNATIQFLSEIASSEESEILDGDLSVGWHVVLFDANKNALGGGCHKYKETARRIAVAEAAERKIVKLISKGASAQEFLIDLYPTTCGFAAGFESEKTRDRSIAEAIERWAWSKWIDENYLIPVSKVSLNSMSKLTQHFITYFDKVVFYQKVIKTSGIPNFANQVNLFIAIAFKGAGVFPGSKIEVNSTLGWEHCLIEAWRHLHINKTYGPETNSSPFPYGRIHFFGNHAPSAVMQIEKAQKLNWPTPNILLNREYITNIPNLYIWRSLMSDYVAWSEGPVERFVY